MANKENLPPSPAFGLPIVRALSPNTKPILRRQRDHSSCRRPDTPLKIRKTRENLRDPYNIPLPTCSHATLACSSAVDAPSTAARNDVEPSSEASTATLPPYSSINNDATLPPLQPQPQRMQRHKSVSRRVLSKVKQGIRNRSQSTHAIRGAESETTLLRRLSGRRKQSSEADRRAQSFEISRDSIDETVDLDRRDAVPGTRSFTTDTVSTREALGDCLLATPPPHSLRSAFGTASRSSSPSTAFPSSPGETPRPPYRQLSAETSNVTRPGFCLPYVELSIDVETPTVDAGVETETWIAMEAILSSRCISIPDTTKGTNASASELGAISSLRLCFKPVSNYRVLEVIGHKASKGLVLGQKCALFVKIHVPPVTSTSRLPGDEHSSLFAELESIIGTLETEVLQVEVRYRHSLLPSDHIVTLRQAVTLKRPKLSSRWSLTTPHAGNQSVRIALAAQIASQYAPERALRVLDRCLGADDSSVASVRQGLLDTIQQQQAALADGGPGKPAVVITDIDSHYPNTTTTDPPPRSHKPPREGKEEAEAEAGEPQDSARKLWQHIRRHSLSAAQLAAELAADPAQLIQQQIDNDDDVDGSERLRELRRQAIANKRSVGAETLRAWKWEVERLSLIHI